ncbi:MAG TPA: hypothetical protein VM869_15335 [Enhygromyxa sp.]|nr:hypothetical protein [Enhygromyxa sp.]
MNPAIFAGVLVALLASSAGRKQEVGPSIGVGSVIAVVIWTTLGPAFVYEMAALIEALARGDLWQAAVALVCVIAIAIVLFPWPIARTLLIPRGRIKLAWAITRLSFWVWSRDVRSGAVIAASWAAIRRAQRGVALEPELLAWIERERDATTRPRWRLGGAGIVATGLLAEARGDRAGARRLLSSALELAEPVRPARAVTLAAEWLCAEAMERGAWREVEFLARTAPVASRRLRSFGAIAARLTGIAPVPSDTQLRLRWLLAPERSATIELLRRALASPLQADSRTTSSRRNAEPPRATHDDALLHALTLHAFTLARPPAQLDRDDLARLAAAWDRALADPKLERRLLERGLALGTRETERSPEQLAALVRDDLLALVRAAGLELGSLGESSELLARAARRLHAELLDDIEITVSALESRVKSKRELPAIDEWQTFLALREQYAAAVAVGGLELRRLAFQELHAPVCSLAVWLWNERNERALGNAMFHWLLAEAIVVDDAEAIRLQERNVDCGI